MKAGSDIILSATDITKSFGGAPTLSNDLAIWRNLWDDGPELAAHAHDYLRTALGGTRVSA
ncbi:hypothetical protein [Diaminobutyricimonas sp. TR449]|uniref:hypothetical protein n=1 Tax=Diaminobutyricimonas sp. TR449 TaxID=2708076 RepID=UPI00142017A8|nr:hypothetical protein [Diaminobutyricimonas sp. TR449]